jgi:hypothetical protein
LTAAGNYCGADNGQTSRDTAIARPRCASAANNGNGNGNGPQYPIDTFPTLAAEFDQTPTASPHGSAEYR